MPRFTVTITREITQEYIAEIDAASEEEALEKAENMSVSPGDWETIDMSSRNCWIHDSEEDSP